MPMNRPGSVSNTSTPSIAATAARKSARAAGRRSPPSRPVQTRVQPAQGGDVDQLDHGGDDDGGERRLGQLLEQPGEEQQRHDRQHRDDQAGDLAACAPAPPLTAVFDRLPLTTIPLQSPAPRFAAPSPISSRFGSIS